MGFNFETERLHIRPWAASDRADLARMSKDADMMRYITGEPWSDERIDELTARIAAHLDTHGICFAALESKSDSEIVGLTGMQQLDNGEFELGWWVWKDHWGQGYAIEGTRPFIEYARDKMGLKRLVAVIDSDNRASKRVAEKLGMRFEGIKSARETMAIRPDLPVDFYAMQLSPKKDRDARI